MPKNGFLDECSECDNVESYDGEFETDGLCQDCQ